MALATPYASASLYVGDLVNEVTEALLFEIFNTVGPVASVRVCRDAATRRSLGYAYVNFHRVEDAERALDTMNFKNIRDRPCRIMWSHRDPSLRKSGLGNIFVKNLATSIDNKSLYDTFSMFGNILSCKVAMNSKRQSLGYGFVHYESEDAALNAISKVNMKVIAGKQVIVAPFKSKKERGGGQGKFTNVYIKNLPEGATQEEVEQLFSQHGEVTSSKVVAEEDGKKGGFGFVNFKTPEEANAAVEALNGHEWNGKKLYVARAQKRDEREKELRYRFEQLKVERQKKYDGVNLYVKNLGDDVNDEKLREEFKQFGAITSAKIMLDSAQKSRGFGFVCFSGPEEATKAVTEMNGRMLDGKPLYVALAQRKEVRRAQLEAQYAARNKMGPVPPQMFAPQGPMFYAPGIPPRNFVYPPQQMLQQRRWAPGQPGQPVPHQMMVGAMPAGPRLPINYQLMPMAANGRQQQAPRGARGRQQQNGMPQQQGAPKNPQQMANGQVMQQRRMQQGGFKYADNVRNPNRAPNAQIEEGAMIDPQAAVVPSEMDHQAPLTIKDLVAADEDQKKQMIGERLFPLIKEQQPVLAGKITGMLLEMDNGELIHLLESQEALHEKITEALQVLEQTQED